MTYSGLSVCSSTGIKPCSSVTTLSVSHGFGLYSSSWIALIIKFMLWRREAYLEPARTANLTPNIM